MREVGKLLFQSTSSLNCTKEILCWDQQHDSNASRRSWSYKVGLMGHRPTAGIEGGGKDIGDSGGGLLDDAGEVGATEDLVEGLGHGSSFVQRAKKCATETQSHRGQKAILIVFLCASVTLWHILLGPGFWFGNVRTHHQTSSLGSLS